MPLAAMAVLWLAAVDLTAWQPRNLLLGASHVAFLFGPMLLATGESRLHTAAILAGLAAVGALAFFVSGWLLASWACLLAGLGLGASLASQGYLRRLACSLQALLCLMLVMFAMVPRMLGISPGVAGGAEEGIIAAAFAVWAVTHAASLFEGGRQLAEPITSTIFYLLFCLMACVVALVVQGRPELDYPLVVLLVSVAALAASGLCWLLWSPVIGRGLSAVFFRHVLSLSVPFDAWMGQMNDLASLSRDGREFWRRAMEMLVDRTDLSGVSWDDDGVERMYGSTGAHSIRMPLAEHGIYLHSETRILPTMSFNIWLLARVALEYRLSKEREARLTAEAAMRSVHELGAGTTHDIKNLLHAINLLCAPGKEASGEGFDGRRREQLLSLAGRLQASLAKLDGGRGIVREAMLDAQTWWQGAQRRHANEAVKFVAPDGGAGMDFKLPAELFDRALENLLHNALRKGAGNEGIQVTVELDGAPGLTVRDNGEPIPDQLEDRLFAAPLPSGDGMGIGLFQLATSCSKLGYQVFVETNEPGEVAFRLERVS